MVFSFWDGGTEFMILPSREMGDDQGQALSIADMESCEALPEDELLTFGENSS